jgi:hypothetical protein
MMLRKLQIRLAFWLLRRSIRPPAKRAQESTSQDFAMDNSDPCHLFVDAVDSTLTQIFDLQTQLEELALVWVDQMDALELCRIQNPE